MEERWVREPKEELIIRDNIRFHDADLAMDTFPRNIYMEPPLDLSAPPDCAPYDRYVVSTQFL